jgi:hypothetical protein
MFRNLLPAIISLVMLGCGTDGPQRYRLQGTITYDGKPVPAGTIIFEPDSSQNNDGPQGLATIHDGVFDSARGGKGTVGGPHRVTILGCDGTSISETSPQGKPLFEPYITTADLPKKNGKLDFDVPSAKAGRAK